MALRPLHDGVIVRPHPQKKKVGSIVIPTSEDRVMTGVVLRVGPGLSYVGGEYRPVELKGGEVVAFLTAVKETGQGQAQQRALDEGELLIHERDVLFVIELEDGDEMPEIT